MKKQKIKVKIPFLFEWTYGIDISKIKEDLRTLENLGATIIEIESEDSYGSSSVIIEAFCRRIETDEEYLQRIEKHKKHKDEIKRIELEQLEKLKAKYDKSNNNN